MDLSVLMTCSPAQASVIPHKSESFSISLTRSSLAIQCGRRAQIHKEAALAGLSIPANHSGHRDR